MNSYTRRIVFCGLFAGLTVVLSQVIIIIPFSPIPITLQVLSVSLAGAVLGSRLGMMSQIVYVLIGIAGIPVFAGFEGGIGVILGPKGGYIVSFPLMAFVIGYLIEKRSRPGIVYCFVSMAAGLVICYTLGTAWLGTVLKLDLPTAVAMGIGWFLPLDILKLIFASIAVFELRKSLAAHNIFTYY